MNQYDYYNGNGQYYDSRRIYNRKQEEKSGIRTIGFTAGICIIAYVIIENVISLPIYVEPLKSIFAKEPVYNQLYVMLLSFAGILVPFSLAGIFLRRRTGVDPFAFRKPDDMYLAGFGVCLGLFLCLAGNYVSSWFVTFIEFSGVKLSSPEFPVPSDILGRIVYCVEIAFVPALVEETAIRGVVMQPLRKYGSVFAIVTSSFIFAVLHGNLIQAPFAMMAGVGLGYVACITNSLWPGIIIHLLNNLYSVAVEFMVEDIKDENLLNRFYLITLIALYAITITGSVIFFMLKGKRRLPSTQTALKPKEKAKAFTLNVPMIIAILIMIWITSQYVKKV